MSTEAAGMVGPSLVIGGAQKAGTTALFYLLAQHPDVFEPAVKEPGYFSAAARPYRFEGPGASAHEKGVISSRSEYEALFRKGGWPPTSTRSQHDIPGPSRNG